MNKDDLLKIARTLGVVVHQASRPQLAQLSPINCDAASPNTASASYGTGKFPYHTDLAHWPKPPRYIIMGNAGESSKVPTLMVDYKISMLQVELQRYAWHAIWRVTKTRFPFACSMILSGATTPGVRWDSNVMVPINDQARQMTCKLTHALEAEIVPNEIQFDWSTPGTVLVLDNWRMLHARPAIHRSESSRTLYRVFATEY